MSGPLDAFISVFENAYKTSPARAISLRELANEIRSVKYAQQINRIRDAKNDEERGTLKRLLPAVTLSGVFAPDGKRGDSKPITHSGIVQIDLDDVENPTALRDRLDADPHVLFAPLSASGTGFKVWFCVPADNGTHERAFRAACDYMTKTHGVTPDTAVKNAKALCFVSYDPDAKINENAVPLPLPDEHPEPAAVTGLARGYSTDEALRAFSYLPDTRPEYGPWMTYMTALRDAIGRERAIVELKKKWPEDEASEYEEKIDEYSRVHAGTLFYHARAHGYVDEKPHVIVPSGDVQVRETALNLARILGPKRELFKRSGTVVELNHTANGPELSHINEHHLVTRVERHCMLFAYRAGKDGAAVLKPTKLNPSDAKAILLSREFLDGLPPIALVSNSAIFTHTGEVLGPGYHTALGGVLVTSQGEPETVSEDEAAASLLALLDDFHFATDADRSRALASMLTPALKMGGHISGPIPLDVAEADQSQSGKTYRQKLDRAIYGEQAYLIAQRRGGVGSIDESISAAAISGKPFIAFDNFRGKLDSQILEAAMTWGKPVSVRVPHRGEVSVDMSKVRWQLSSNGVETTPDLANRSVMVRIKKQAAGYVFKTYPEGDLLSHVEARQPYYLGCVFALLRSWLARGRPRTKGVEHDFREWAAVLDWFVQTIFCAAPLMEGHRTAQQRVSNPALTWLRKVCVEVNSDELDRVREYRATDLLELCSRIGLEVPGAKSDDSSMGPTAIGRLMGRLFADKPSQVVEIDQYRVKRRSEEEYDDVQRKTKIAHFYSFSTH
jgi:hypothetical protein